MKNLGNVLNYWWINNNEENATFDESELIDLDTQLSSILTSSTWDDEDDNIDINLEGKNGIA